MRSKHTLCDGRQAKSTSEENTHISTQKIKSNGPNGLFKKQEIEKQKAQERRKELIMVTEKLDDQYNKKHVL